MKSYAETFQRWNEMPVELTEDQLLVGDWQVMQSWEAPLMEVLAEEVTASGGHILEIGFGMGISANRIVAHGCASYTVIEMHPGIVSNARKFAAEQSLPCEVIEGAWQDVVPLLDRRFDGVLFDTYPLSAEERGKNHFSFIPVAPSLLRGSGVFVCYSDDTKRFRSEHLELLLTHFDEVTLRKVTGLEPPKDCEYWQHGHMVIPAARRPVGATGSVSEEAVK